MERRVGPRPQRVLLVDDSADIREVWRLWLSFWGFAVDEAQNGYDAVEKAARTPPDLILMDLWMPVLDGVEATKRLKSDERTAGIPIVAMSAQTFQPDPGTVIAAGADTFIPKPYEPDVLLEHIRSVMSRLHFNRTHL